MKTISDLTTGQRYMYRMYRAEAKRLAARARRYDREGRTQRASMDREEAMKELEAAKALLTTTDARLVRVDDGAHLAVPASAATVECAYCLADVAERGDAVPAVDDDDAWGELAAEHQVGCEWIETRAHRVPATLGRLAREIAAGGLSMSEAAGQLALGRLYRVDTLSAGHDCVVDADSADGALAMVAEYADLLVGERPLAGWSAAQVVA